MADNSVPASVVVNPLPTIEEVVSQLSSAPGPKSAGMDQLQAAMDDKSNRSVEQVPEIKEQNLEVVKSIPEPVAPVERDPTAAKFAAIARREREAKAREKQAEDRQRQIDARNKELEARDTAVAAKEARLAEIRKSPLKNLKELGVTWQDLIQDSVGGYKEPEVDPLDKRFMSVDERLSKLDALEKQVNEKFTMLEQKEMNNAIREVEDNIRETASDEKYEFIQVVGDDAYSLVKQVMAEFFSKNQRLLDYSEACDIVEEYYEKEYDKFHNTKKVKGRATSTATSTPAAAPTKPVTPRKEAKETPQSLSSTHATATQATIDIDKLPRNEAIAHLAKQLRFRE